MNYVSQDTAAASAVRPCKLTTEIIARAVLERLDDLRAAFAKWPKPEAPIVILVDDDHSFLLERAAVQFEDVRVELEELGVSGLALSQLKDCPGPNAFWVVHLIGGLCGSARASLFPLSSSGGDA